MRISSDLRRQMLAHVLGCLPEEACGLLGGTPAEAVRVLVVENELHSPVRFRMRAFDQLNAFLAMEKENLELVGIFHSHPTSPPYPSPTDIAEFSYPGALFLIWAPLEGAWQVRAFHIEGSQVIPVEIEE
jgi:[CysO sulfur-carrier protein]-S-L-cysteine hydrolase